MPNLNGMGPDGQGPMTGRAMGNCDDVTPRFSRRRCSGLGLRRFFGGRRQRLTLEDQEKLLEEELEAVRREKSIQKDNS
jgi:hypothetical protein